MPSDIIIDERSGASVQERDGAEPSPSPDPQFRTLQAPQRPTPSPPGNNVADDMGLRRVPRKNWP
jgi:hypothetical protein